MKMPHIFIDANVFISQSYKYDSTAFKQIISLVQAKKVFVYLTTVTVSEVVSNIEKDVYKAHEAFEGFREKPQLRILKNVSDSPLHGVFNGFDREQAKEALLKQFSQFIRDTNALILEITDVSVDDVFEKYFSRSAPFGEDKKKHEFPDAFAMAALENWCKKHSIRMYVISEDPDLIIACESSESLTFVQSLSEFLDLFSEGEQQAEIASKLFEEHKEEIERRIREAINNLSLLPYEPHDEVQYVHIDPVEFLKHYLIEIIEGKAIFEVRGRVHYSAQILHHNYAIAMMMGMAGWDEEMKYGSNDIRAEVCLLFNVNNPDDFKIKYATIKDHNVRMFPGDDDDPNNFMIMLREAEKSRSSDTALIIEALGGMEHVLASTPEEIMKRFDSIKETLPVRVILNLRTRTNLHPYKSGLNYQGAMMIKQQAEAAKRESNKKPLG
jgi:predicted nucleic acid-binding protein